MSSNRHDHDVEHLMLAFDVDFPYYNFNSSDQRLAIGKTAPLRHDREDEVRESNSYGSELFASAYSDQRESPDLKMSDVFHLLLEQK